MRLAESSRSTTTGVVSIPTNQFVGPNDAMLIHGYLISDTSVTKPTVTQLDLEVLDRTLSGPAEDCYVEGSATPTT